MAKELSDIPDIEISELIRKYGEPKRVSFSAPFLEFECDLVRRSAIKGRNHDITCFIRKDNGYVTIQKHAYADSGIHRAPSGGARFGESLEDAARREMQEETGLEIRLLRFVLDAKLDVVCNDEIIPWRSLVFLAESIGGDMKPLDTFEIYDVRISTREEMLGKIHQLMLDSGWGGFSYRAFLTRNFFEQLDVLNV